jgi:hypothetical protein
MTLWLLCFSLLQAPPVEVTTLAGESFSGSLRGLTTQSLDLDRDGTPVSIPTSDVLQWRMTSPVVTANPVDPASLIVAVELHDGSRLRGTALAGTSEKLTLTHPVLNSVTLGRGQVKSVRFGAEDPAVAASWQDFQERTKKQDYLVVRKGDVLDHLDGVIGGLDDQRLKFLLDGQEIDVKRPRIFGWIYASEAPAKGNPGIRVDLTGGDTISVNKITQGTTGWDVQLAGSTTTITLATAAVTTVDYSAGKVLYLSSVEPRDLEHTPYFGPGIGSDWRVERDRSLLGRPLKVGRRTYAKGLAIHSKTRLVYRLGGSYRRLSSIVGIDPELDIKPDPIDNNARLVIRGDRKVLFEGDIRLGQPPVPLDLNVQGVVELEILVDYGVGHSDVGDRVHMADLKVLK